jgi:hypothetical protein
VGCWTGGSPIVGEGRDVGRSDSGTVGITATGVFTAGRKATTAVSVASGPLTVLGERIFVPTTTKKNAHEKRSKSRASTYAIRALLDKPSGCIFTLSSCSVSSYG